MGLGQFGSVHITTSGAERRHHRPGGTRAGSNSSITATAPPSSGDTDRCGDLRSAHRQQRSPLGHPAFTLVVNSQAPIFGSVSSTTFGLNQPNTFKVVVSGTPTPSIIETGVLPTGVSFIDNGDGTATLSGTPSVAGTFLISFTASNGVGAPVIQNFTLTVTPAPTFTSLGAVTLQRGLPAIFIVTTTAPFGTTTTLSTNNAALPAGVTFVDNGDGTATISGTPGLGVVGAIPFTYTFTIIANDGAISNQLFTITVDQAPIITSAPGTTFAAQGSRAPSRLQSGNPPAAFNVIGSLPSGVVFKDNGDGTATLSGTPTTPGSFALTVTAGNSIAPLASQAFTLTVERAPIFTSSNGAIFTAGQTGSFTIQTAPGTDPSVTITESGALPSGLSFKDNGDGTATLTGQPLTSAAGIYVMRRRPAGGVSTANLHSDHRFDAVFGVTPAYLSSTSRAFLGRTSGLQFA